MERQKEKNPLFDGKLQWESYIAQFKIVAAMKQWNDDQKGTILWQA